MYQLKKLKNGLTLITINLPHLNSVTTLVAVGAGSRYESKKISGISHFLEHMFFKGSKKYPTTEIIGGLIDGIGGINNAATDKEYTYYWIKSAAVHIELACDVLSSQIKESLFDEGEIEKEKGVIIEEIKMYYDNPQNLVWILYDKLQFGDHPLGWDIAGEIDGVKKFNRTTFLNYMQSLYSPKNMVLVFAGRLPKNISKIADEYFSDLPINSDKKYLAFKSKKQTKPKVNVHFKTGDQAQVVLGMEAYSRNSRKKYALKLIDNILGEGLSSRLFLEIREKRGLAYRVGTGVNYLLDTGFFAVFGGFRLEKLDEAISCILTELTRLTTDLVSPIELKKAKEIEKGRLAIRSESTNFLATHFGTEYILDKKIESFPEYIKKIEAVTSQDIQAVAKELFNNNRYNLQIVGPIKSKTKFSKLLN